MTTLAGIRHVLRWVLPSFVLYSGLQAQTPRPKEIEVTYFITEDQVTAEGVSEPAINVQVRATFDTPYTSLGVYHQLRPTLSSQRGINLNAVVEGPLWFSRLAPGGNREFAGSILWINSDQYRPAGWGNFRLNWSKGLPPAMGVLTDEYLAEQFPATQALTIPIPDIALPALAKPAFLTGPTLTPQRSAVVNFQPLLNAPPGSYIDLNGKILPPDATSGSIGPVQPRDKLRIPVSYYWRLSQTVIDGVTVTYNVGRTTWQDFVGQPTPQNLSAAVFGPWSSRVARGDILEFDVRATVNDPELIMADGSPQGTTPKAATYRLLAGDTVLQSGSSSILLLDTKGLPDLATYQIEVSANGETVYTRPITLEVVDPGMAATVTFLRHPSPEPLYAIRSAAALALVADAMGPNGERFIPKFFAGQASLTYRWYKDGVPTDQTGPYLIVKRVTPEIEGSWTVRATAGGRTAESKPFVVKLGEFTTIPEVRLVNVSARVNTGEGENQVVIGAATSGPSRLLIRHVGPSLNLFRLASPLADPTLSLFDGERQIGFNDDWDNSGGLLETLFEEVGAFSLFPNSKDSTLVRSVPSGRITAVLGSQGPPVGTSLAEFYAIEGEPVLNMSVRGQLSRVFGSASLGFVLAGSGEKQYLIRVMGSGLKQFGLDSGLNPSLTLFEEDKVIATNLDWESATNSGVISETLLKSGGAPLQSGQGEAAILVTLGAGQYTVAIRPETNTEGLYLAEVWEVPKD